MPRDILGIPASTLIAEHRPADEWQPWMQGEPITGYAGRHRAVHTARPTLALRLRRGRARLRGRLRVEAYRRCWQLRPLVTPEDRAALRLAAVILTVGIFAVLGFAAVILRLQGAW